MPGPAYRKLPALEAYLDARAVEPEPLERPPDPAPLAIAFAIFVCTTVGFIGNGLPNALLIGAAVGGVIGCLSAWVRNPKLAEPQPAKTELERLEDRLRTRLTKRADREIDPAAAAALEACAREWNRIAAAAQSEAWDSPSTGDSWRTSRKGVLEQADAAMAEAIVACQPGIGRVHKRERQAFRRSLTQMKETDFESLVSAVPEGQASGEDEQRLFSALCNPQFSIGPVRRIAALLKELANEMEASQMMLEASGPEEPLVHSHLEATLANLREHRRAEEELEQSVNSTGV